MKHFNYVLSCVLVAFALVNQAPAQPFVDGIDVSYWQGNINWTSVRNSGVEFAFIRSSRDDYFIDSQFQQNIVGATNAGVIAGAYHYAKPDTDYGDPNDAVNEANHFLSQIQPYYSSGQYLPPVLDVEEFNFGGLSTVQMRSYISGWVQDFSDTVQASLGVRPIIYSSQSHANTYFSRTISAQHQLWMAWWKNSTVNPPTQSDAPNWPLWDFWQYSSTGSVPGISGNVDLDVFNGTRQELEAMLIGDGGGGTDGVTMIENFDVNEGYFGSLIDYSGSTTGVGSGSSADRVTTEAYEGAGSQQLFIDGANDGWFLRHVAGIGSVASPAGNLAFDTTGYLGFWLKTDDPGISVRPAIDAPDTADRGVAQDVIADGQWHLYEWNLEDDAQWEAWVNGDGIIDAATATLDSIMFSGAGQATLYLDSVSHNPTGSLAPEVTLPGDFNDDGTVNLADFNVWRDHLGTDDESVLNGNGSGNGVVDTADYQLWKDNVGQSSGTLAQPAAAIPEPSAALISGVLVGLLSTRRIRRAAVLAEKLVHFH